MRPYGVEIKNFYGFGRWGLDPADRARLKAALLDKRTAA
jgi:hypothetical protein